MRHRGRRHQDGLRGVGRGLHRERVPVGDRRGRRRDRRPRPLEQIRRLVDLGGVVGAPAVAVVAGRHHAAIGQQQRRRVVGAQLVLGRAERPLAGGGVVELDVAVDRRVPGAPVAVQDPVAAADRDHRAVRKLHRVVVGAAVVKRRSGESSRRSGLPRRRSETVESGVEVPVSGSEAPVHSADQRDPGRTRGAARQQDARSPTCGAAGLVRPPMTARRSCSGGRTSCRSVRARRRNRTARHLERMRVEAAGRWLVLLAADAQQRDEVGSRGVCCSSRSAG